MAVGKQLNRLQVEEAQLKVYLSKLQQEASVEGAQLPVPGGNSNASQEATDRPLHSGEVPRPSPPADEHGGTLDGDQGSRKGKKRKVDGAEASAAKASAPGKGGIGSAAGSKARNKESSGKEPSENVKKSKARSAVKSSVMADGASSPKAKAPKRRKG